MKDNRAVLVKVCGLTDTVEADYLNKNKVDFAGFVLFFPKSKRNISIEKAEQIMAELDENIKKVAVIVSPDESEIQQINGSGFDYVQIPLTHAITLPFFIPVSQSVVFSNPLFFPILISELATSVPLI